MRWPRRFDPAQVGEALTEAGFDVVCSRRFDKLGRLFGGRLGPQQASFADRFWPLARLADWLLPFSGQTLLVVGRKPGLALQSPRRASLVPLALRAMPKSGSSGFGVAVGWAFVGRLAASLRSVPDAPAPQRP